jgi:CheY-like chemotaxis protein
MFKMGDQAPKFAVAGILIALAVARLAYHPSVSGRMDTIFFVLIGGALLLILIPIERLKSLKAGGIEVVLEQPQVQGAITRFGTNRIENEEIRSRLSRLQDQLALIHGSRVMWIDDNPRTILGERRLLRALGVEVVQAISSEDAEAVLVKDEDFDLIITDVQRTGKTYEQTGGVKIHEGVNFIVKLRQKKDPDSVVKKLPVIFYAAYTPEELEKWTRPARDYYPIPEIADSSIDLVQKAVKLLAEVRSAPIVARLKKQPTSVVWPDAQNPARSA